MKTKITETIEVRSNKNSHVIALVNIGSKRPYLYGAKVFTNINDAVKAAIAFEKTGNINLI